MRGTTRATINHYLKNLDISGDVLEIGGYKLSHCAINLFPEPRFRYRDLDIERADIPNTVVANITDCSEQLPDNSVDLVISSDVFEHIDRPWLAAAEIARILRPGGLAITWTLWAWRNHPCPIDYWRFSPECLAFLFSPLECLEKGYDLSQRRENMIGFWNNGRDSVPIDRLGGFRDNWAVYSVHRKGAGPAVPTFKDSGHPLADPLRQDTQGTITDLRMLGLQPRHVASTGFNPIDKRLAAIERRLVGLGRRGHAPQLLSAYRTAKQRLRDHGN